MEKSKFLLISIVVLATISMCVQNTRSQASWESYEEYSEEDEDEKFDFYKAKEEFCVKTKIRDQIIHCLKNYDLPDYYDKWALMCLPSLGIHQTDVAEILEEVCRPDSDRHLGAKLRECMKQKMREKKFVSRGYTGIRNLGDLSLFTLYCDPLATAILNRGWMRYFFVHPSAEFY